jgi:hypothetical protein
MICGCTNVSPHYSAKYDFSCIGCYARWVIDCYGTPAARLEAIESNKHHDVDLLKAEVAKRYRKGKRV